MLDTSATAYPPRASLGNTKDLEAGSLQVDFLEAKPSDGIRLGWAGLDAQTLELRFGTYLTDELVNVKREGDGQIIESEESVMH